MSIFKDRYSEGLANNYKSLISQQLQILLGTTGYGPRMTQNNKSAPKPQQQIRVSNYISFYTINYKSFFGSEKVMGLASSEKFHISISGNLTLLLSLYTLRP